MTSIGEQASTGERWFSNWMQPSQALEIDRLARVRPASARAGTRRADDYVET